MAGRDPENAMFGAEFRADIREVMLMGLPVQESDRYTFMFVNQRIMEPNPDFTNASPSGVPYDWYAPSGDGYGYGGSGEFVPDPEREPVQVLAVFEDRNMDEEESSMGTVDNDSANIYLFEDEWAQVSDFTHVMIGGSTYRRVARMPPLSLYDVQLEKIRLEAVDET